MSDWLVYSIGFMAQFLFFARVIVQWFQSEKHQKVVTPYLFWVFSLVASLLLFFYGYLRKDFAIMLGQSLTYFIYVRNLQLQNQWNRMPFFLRLFFLIIPVAIVIYYFNNNIIDVNLLFNNNIPLWLMVLGIIGQVVFTFRFIYQWIYSEKKKQSTLPLGFWLLSIAGTTLILIYAIIRLDPVLFVGHGLGLIIYIRNLMLLKNTVNQSPKIN